ncbi:MAG: hypothetical protein R3F62_19220 [Planctomycetota bacterium]
MAEAIAEALGAPLLRWHVKSTTRAQDGLYVYDTVQRLYDSRFGDGEVMTFGAISANGPRASPRGWARAGGAPDRRGRQGGHRVPQRPPARA